MSERTKEEIVENINFIVDKHIQPAVAQHGGVVKLEDFDMETGDALMLLSGACSGCASSSITLKLGVENLSGISMDDVKVHTNSDQPAQMQAHAFAQGTDIHIAPGQEKHLAHEAWHVVQQKQGRVKPTRQMKDDTPVNDDKNLEIEADQMGAKALRIDNNETSSAQLKQINSPNQALQRSSKSTLQKEGEDTAEPKAKDADKETGMKEVNKHSFELEIPYTFKASIEYDEDEEKGTVEIGDAEKGEAFKGVGGSGTVEIAQKN